MLCLKSHKSDVDWSQFIIKIERINYYMFLKGDYYSCAYSRDHKILAFVGNKISICSLQENNPKEVQKFKCRKNSAECKLSSDGKMLAVCDTAGNITVYDTTGGNAVLSNDTLGEEAETFDFILNDSYLIASDMAGNLMTVSLSDNKCTDISGCIHIKNTETVCGIFKLQDDRCILVTISSEDCLGCSFYLLQFEDDNIQTTDLATDTGLYIERICGVKIIDDKIFFAYNHDDENNLNCTVAYYDISQKRFVDVLNTLDCFENSKTPDSDIEESLIHLLGKLNFQAFLGFESSCFNCSDYFTDLCLSEDKRYLFVAFTQKVFMIDLKTKEKVREIVEEYINQIVSVGKKLYVVGGNGVTVIDF